MRHDDYLFWKFRLPGVAASVPQTRHRIRSVLAPAGIDSSKVELAVTEAVSNAVRHGYRGVAGWIEVELAVDERAVDVVIRDYGVGLSMNPDSEGLQVGLLMMGSLADRLELEAGPHGGTTVRMLFTLPSESDAAACTSPALS